MRIVLAVALGGALGSVARHALALLLAGFGPAAATLAANGVGSFLIGFLWVRFGAERPVLRAFAITGFCGGFTTFSMFSLEILALVEAEGWMPAVTGIAASLAVWLAAVTLGFRLGRRTPEGSP